MTMNAKLSPILLYFQRGDPEVIVAYYATHAITTEHHPAQSELIHGWERVAVLSFLSAWQSNVRSTFGSTQNRPLPRYPVMP